MSDADGADGVADAAGVAEADDGCNSGSNTSGSKSGSDSGSDSGSEDDSGSSSEAAVAATAKAEAAPSRVVEKFELDLSMTLEEHVASHDYPKNTTTCGACKFWETR